MGLFGLFSKKNDKNQKISKKDKADNKNYTFITADDGVIESERLKESGTKLTAKEVREIVERQEASKKRRAPVLSEKSKPTVGSHNEAVKNDSPLAAKDVKEIVKKQEASKRSDDKKADAAVKKNEKTDAKAPKTEKKKETAPAKKAESALQRKAEPLKPTISIIPGADGDKSTAAVRVIAPSGNAAAGVNKASKSVEQPKVKTVSGAPEPEKFVEAKSGEVTFTSRNSRVGKFEIKKAKDGRFCFNLYASNNVIVATSQVYTSSASAMNGIRSVIANAEKAGIEDQTLKNYTALPYPKWEIYIDKGNQFRFRLSASNGSCICHSQGYTSKANCKNGIESIRKFCSDADVKKAYLEKKDKK